MGISEACPDTGACHHGCPGAESGRGLPCFRVLSAGPLSIAKYPNDTWPRTIREEHRLAQISQEEPVVEDMAEKVREAVDAMTFESPTAAQVEYAFLFLAEFMDSVGRGWRDMPLYVDQEQGLVSVESTLAPDEGWPDEHLIHAARWIREHSEEIIGYMVDSVTEDSDG